MSKIDERAMNEAWAIVGDVGGKTVHRIIEAAKTQAAPDRAGMEKVREACDRALRWMYSEIKGKPDPNENNYNQFVQLEEALAILDKMMGVGGELGN